MLKGYVLRYLAAVATEGTREAGRRAIPAPLRGIVRKRADRHVAVAGFETDHASDDSHLHRMAYLAIQRVPTIDSNDVAGVATTFREHRATGTEARAGLRLALSTAAVALVLVGAGVGYWVQSRPPAPPPETASDEDERSLEEILGIETEERHPLEDLFEHGLPDYVVALDRRSAGRERVPPDDVASRRAAVLSRLEGTELTAPMERVLDAAEGFVDGAEGHDQGHWLAQLVLLHDGLESEGVPFYVDAELRHGYRGRRRVLMSTWNVHGRRELRSGELTIHALEITRLDSLNFERSLLGYTRPESRYALVVRDRIERFLVEDVLPSVHAAEDSVIVRGYEHETGIEWVTEFEDWAHDDLRREAEAEVSAEMENEVPLDHLAAAIVRRRNAVAALSSALPGHRLREPRAHRYDVDYVAGLAGQSAGPAISELRQAEAAVHTEEAERAYEVLLDAFSASVAEHEAQHRLDYESDRLVHVPEALAEYTGETEELDRVNRLAERANAELSAYLSQLARRPSHAFTSLIHVAGFLMSRPSWGMPESYAAATLIEALADEAGLSHVDLIDHRVIARAEVARIYGALRTRSAEELSELAARTWARLYRTELPPLRPAP